MRWLPPSGSRVHVVECTAYSRASRGLACLSLLRVAFGMAIGAATPALVASYIAAVLVTRRLFVTFHHCETTRLGRRDWQRHVGRSLRQSGRLAIFGTALLTGSRFAQSSVLADLGVATICTAVLLPCATVFFLHRLMKDNATVMIRDDSVDVVSA